MRQKYLLFIVIGIVFLLTVAALAGAVGANTGRSGVSEAAPCTNSDSSVTVHVQDSSGSHLSDRNVTMVGTAYEGATNPEGDASFCLPLGAYHYQVAGQEYAIPINVQGAAQRHTFVIP